MDVKPGYKQTELGVIPEDWIVEPLLQRLRKPPSYGINAPAIPFDSRFPTYLRITDITDDGRFSEATKVSVDHSASASHLLEPGDVVFARTGASVGKSYRYNPDDGRLVCAGFLIRICPDCERMIPAFLAYFAQSRTYWNWVKVNSMRSGQPGINGREYARLPVPLPPTKVEQEAIVEALGDADVFIESLEDLLVKKRQVKQGAMQELLTGKKRLPGFQILSNYKNTEVGVIPGDWNSISISGVADKVTVGFVGSMAHLFTPDGVPLLRGQNVLPNRIDLTDTLFISAETHKRWKKSALQYGDVVMVRVGYPGTSCVIPDNLGEANAASLVVVRPIQEKLSAEFLSLIINSDFGKRQIESYLVGGAQQVLNTTTAAGFQLPLPTKAEQDAIAAILSDMDAEIAALEDKLTKARNLKQGMMQELLTGRIRLI